MHKNGLTAMIVEDEEHIADLLETNLTIDGYQTIVCDLGEKAVETVKFQHVDIVLLDVMLPDSSGIDICRSIKHIRQDIPILMLSALGQSSDRIKGLKSGADDYLPKPFELEELTLRMNNLIDRFGIDKTIKNEIELGSAVINFDQYTINRDTAHHKLTSKEALLLKFIVEHRGEVISRQLILDEVWGFERFPNSRTIDNFIATFRKFIEENPGEPQIITTVRGVGYRIS